VKSSLLFIALLLQTLSAGAAQQPLATLSDPLGDDNGTGALIYPRRTDFHIGDLDLRQLQISRDDEGFWFSATFKNNIRDPKDVAYTVGAETLENFARKGFYQFNVDIYVDTDRVPGSGNTFTLPGRQVGIDPQFAWERAVMLTPRPELMRQQLLDVLAEQFPDLGSAEIAASIDQSVIFPTRIRVRGRSVEFFVPAGFFAGSNGAAWSVTALVTGALTAIPFDVSLSSSIKKPLAQLQLGVMQPAPGQPKDSFGYSGAAPSPVVDLLAASVEQQTRQLAAKHALSGVAWGAEIANAASAVAVTSPAATGSVIPLGRFFEPEPQSAAQPAAAGPAMANPPAEPSIVQRMQTLQQLFDQKLIDEAEYKQQKQRILQNL